MTPTHALRYAGIVAVAALLATSLGTHTLHAQSTGTPSADSAAKKKADAAKAATAKQAADKQQKPVTAPGRADPTGY